MSGIEARTALVRVALAVLVVGCVLALTNLRLGFRSQAIGPVPDPDPWLLGAYLAAGFTLLGAGVLALWNGVSARAGVLAILAGLAWFLPDVAQLWSDPSIVRGLGPAASVLTLPLVLHLVLAASPVGRRDRGLGGMIVLIDLAALAIASAWLLTYAPFYDPRCIEACRAQVSIVDPGRPGRELLRDVTDGLAIVVGAVLTFVATRHAPFTGRRSPSRMAIAAGGLTAGVAGVGLGMLGLAGAAMALDPSDGIGTGLHAATSVALIVLAVGLALGVRQVMRSQRRIRELAHGIATAPPPGALAAALADALDDPALRLGYRVEGHESFVGADGTPFGPAARSGRTQTPIARGPATIGVIDHRDDVDAETLSRELRPSLLVALDNERLRATQLAQLHDLQASRARIVEVGDAERRRIERDLHDGAQQRLLAIAFDLRLGRLLAEREGRSGAGERLAEAERLALGIVEELRRICQGIHPALLTQAGLGPALVSLAEGSAIRRGRSH